VLPVADCAEENPNPPPFVLAGGNRRELREQARDLQLRLDEKTDLTRLSAQLAERLRPLPHRAAVLAQDADDLSEKLAGLGAGRRMAGVFEGERHGSARVVFMFPPLRSEYPGMGLDLLGSHSSFRHHMQTRAATLAGLVDWSPEAVLHEEPGSPPLERLDVSQPLLFTTSSALAELWGSFGVRPDAVVGHSIGEIAAAASCGALGPTDAARVAVTWGRSSMRLEGTGEMASLPLPAAAVEERIRRWDGRLWIAALNAPSWTAVSGEGEALEELLDELAEEGLHGRPMNIRAPGHSPGMAPVHDWFMEELAELLPQPGNVPFYSALRGDCIAATDLDAGYWSRNLREPVLFESAARALLRDRYDVFIEVGPRPVLTTAIEEIAGAGTAALGTLEQGEPGSFVIALAQAYVHGVDANWAAMCSDPPPLPARFRSSNPEVLPSLQGLDLLDLVLEQVASALGHPSPAAIDPNRPFKDLGFDSAGAVELRNVLNRITGLVLPSTLAFDYPTPREVAGKIRLELEGGGQPVGQSQAAEIDDLDLAGLVELVLEEGDRQPERG
jgi:acyl transferase domain-containing protein/acyl carrier protein